MISEAKMQTLDSPTIKDLLDRLQRIRPETRALWGRMNVHQMICHLNDSFGLAMGDKTASEDITFLNRTLIKGGMHSTHHSPGHRGYQRDQKWINCGEVRRPSNFRATKPRWPQPSNGSRGSQRRCSLLVIRSSANSRAGNGCAGVIYTPITTSASSECRRWRFGDVGPCGERDTRCYEAHR